MADSTTPTGASASKTPPPAQTPSQRDILPSSARRLAMHTPLDRTAAHDLRSSVRRGTPGRRATGNEPTPHATAARRALDQRRTAVFTPGKNRRRSLRDQRETPMGILRNLGRVLAPQSKPITTSSSSGESADAESSRRRKSATAPLLEGDEEEEQRRRRETLLGDDLSSDSPIERPRLSLPMDLDDDSEEELRPPRLSGVEQENYTVQSIELPRRFTNETIPRLSRSSFGSLQAETFLDQNEPTDDMGRQSDFFPGLLDELRDRPADQDDDYERLDADPTLQSNLGRDSDFGLDVPTGVEDQTTFVLSDPIVGEAAPTSPVAEATVTEATAAADAAADQLLDNPVDDFSDRGDFGNEPMFFDDARSSSDIDAPAAAIDDTRASTTLLGAKAEREQYKPRKKQKRVSRHDIEYPPLPSAFVKKVAQTALQSSGISNPRITADTLDALTQASDWFFEQLGDDLSAYANHAKRKTIEESDVATLMRRQRQVGSNATMFSLAQKHLPRELLQELRMPVPQPTKRRRTKRSLDDDAEDVTDIT